MPEPEGFWARRGTRTEELTGTHCAGLLPTSRGAHAAREAPFDKGSQERRIEGAPLPVWGGCIHMAARLPRWCAQNSRANARVLTRGANRPTNKP